MAVELLRKDPACPRQPSWDLTPAALADLEPAALAAYGNLKRPDLQRPRYLRRAG